jgi:hypothetical protein
MEYDNTEQALTSNQKGQIGQTFFEYLMSSKGIPCFKPLGDYLYDYIIIYNNVPLRVECKSSSTYENDAITFPINHSAGRKNTVPYTKEEVDLIFCYSIITKECCLLPIKVFEERRVISIRSGNGIAGNKHKYNCFNDFDFDSVCVETLHEIPSIHRMW